MSASNSDPNSLATRGGDQGQGAEPAGGVFRLDALGGGSEAGTDTFNPPKGRLSTQSLLLAILLAAGVGLVYGMRVLGVGALRNLASATMPDYDISRGGSKTLEHKKAIEELHASDIKTQVPPDEVQKNPFKMADALTKTTTTVGGDDSHNKQLAEKLRRDSESRRKRIADSIASMKVNSILGGPKPVARVDGDFVRVGDTLNDLFTVTAIQGRSIVLECDGNSYTLTMDEDLNEIHKGKKK